MEAKKAETNRKRISADWFVSGILTKAGEAIDRLTGRNWRPSSSLATSELIGRLTHLLDLEVRNDGKGGNFVPHDIKVKMQWDKFSTDAEKSIQGLKNELHAAMIDHINDKRYYTYAPISIEIKPDYFIDGVQLTAGFESPVGGDAEAAIDLKIPVVNNSISVAVTEVEGTTAKDIFVARFTVAGLTKEARLEFAPGERKSVGRSGACDLQIDEISVSGAHASLVFNRERGLVVADTGSTNGTFINGRRISYGPAVPVSSGDTLTIGSVDVELTFPDPEKPAGLPGSSGPSGDESAEIEATEYKPVKGADSTSIPVPDEVGTGTDTDVDTKPTQPGIILDFGDEKR